MQKIFQIHIASLSLEESYTCKEEISCDFLDIDEKDLSFEGKAPLSVKAYLTDDHLIIQLHVQMIATMPCNICNEKATSLIQLKNHYITKPLCEIKENFFDFSDELRQAILLEVPAFMECENGTCPKRDEIKKYYKETQAESVKEDETYFPFEDLDHHFKNEG